MKKKKEKRNFCKYAQSSQFIFKQKNGGCLRVNPRRKDFSMQSLQKRCMHSMTTLAFRMIPIIKNSKQNNKLDYTSMYPYHPLRNCNLKIFIVVKYLFCVYFIHA